MDRGNRNRNSNTGTSAAGGNMETSENDEFGSGSTPGSTGSAAYGSSYNPATDAEPIKSTVQDTVQQVQDTAGQVAEQAQDTAGKVIDQVKSTATNRLEDQKNKAAEGVASVAQAIHEAGRNMDDSSPIAEYANKAAQYLEGVSNHLQARDLRTLLTEVEHFARRQPTLFIGGGLLLGMLGARFLKSSGSAAEAAAQPAQNTSYSRAGTYPSSYNSASSGYGRASAESFTTQGNFTREGANFGTSADQADMAGGGDDGQTIRSHYRVTTDDAGSSEV